MTSTISIHPTFNVVPTYSTLGLREHTFVWALIGSFVLHILAVSVLPKLHFERAAQQEVMQVKLAPAVKPQPEPEPVKPEPVKPQAAPKPEPRPTPAPRHIIAPSPIVEPLPHTESVPEPSPPAAITAPAKPETPPTFTVPPPPPPEPPRPSSPSQQDIDAARNLYGSLLGREIAKYKQYPEIARRRGWQGEVVVDIQLDKNGNLQSSTIQKSSNHEALDKQALEMVKKAAPFPAPPEALRGSTFNILVPVSFHLE
jgi:protein TonB